MSSIVKKHGFDKDEALARMQALTDYWKKHGIITNWNDNVGSIVGKVKGMSFEGQITVTDGEVRAAVKANIIARKMGSAYVEGKLKDYLDSKHSLDALKARATA